MYKAGYRKKNIKRVFFVLFFLLLIITLVGGGVYTYLTYFQTKTEIKQVKTSTQIFDPNKTKHNLFVDTELYTMELPEGWKQIANNPDTRYSSTRWQNQNRIVELYTDKIPPEVPFNKIIPVLIENNIFSVGSISDNCSEFTAKISEANLKVPSKWDSASFLCDLSNWNDNIVGVSDKVTGTSLKLSGKLKGSHTYMFVYTDRGIPEDQAPIITALNTLLPK